MEARPEGMGWQSFLKRKSGQYGGYQKGRRVGGG